MVIFGITVPKNVEIFARVDIIRWTVTLNRRHKMAMEHHPVHLIGAWYSYNFISVD